MQNNPSLVSKYSVNNLVYQKPQRSKILHKKSDLNRTIALKTQADQNQLGLIINTNNLYKKTEQEKATFQQFKSPTNQNNHKFNQYDISFQQGKDNQTNLNKSSIQKTTSNIRSKSYTQYYSKFNKENNKQKQLQGNALPKLSSHNNKVSFSQNQMMKNALRQLFISTQLLKKVYGIPDMSFVFQQPNQGALYLGNFFAAQNVQDLKKNNVSAVLTVAKMLPIEYSKEDRIEHLVIQALDADFQNLSQFFEQTNSFLDSVLMRKKNVLVHCAAGVSRSTTCTLAYMMSKHNKSLSSSYQLVKQQRKIVNPNPGFISQLKRYESLLNLKKKTNNNFNL